MRHPNNICRKRVRCLPLSISPTSAFPLTFCHISKSTKSVTPSPLKTCRTPKPPSVVELGAGTTGKAEEIAASCGGAKPVTLSDGNPHCVASLTENIQRNQKVCGQDVQVKAPHILLGENESSAVEPTDMRKSAAKQNPEMDGGSAETENFKVSS